MGFALVVTTYSEMVILLDNHILNLNVRQIARILLKMLFKMKLGQCLTKLIFGGAPCPFVSLGLLFLKYSNNQNKE